jgi:hypothetical protein
MVRALLASWCVVTLGVLAAGCTNFPSQSSIEGSGPTSGRQVQTASCSTLVELDLDLGGSGPVSISVTDGAGHTVYANDNDVTGSIDTTDDLSGVTGTWTLTVDVSDFDGSYNVELQCP